MPASTEEAPNAEHSPLDESNSPPNKVRFGRVRHWLARFNPIGLIFALAFYCWSMSPSLLPRPWSLQAVASGVSAAIGYGLGVLVLWLLHKCGLTRQWTPRWQRAGWITIGIVALVLIPTFLVLGSWWQDISRELVGIEPGSNWDYFGVFAVGAVVFLLCLLIGRGLRQLVHLLDRFVDRFLPAPIALGVSALVVTVIVVLMIEGILSTGIARIANGSAAVADKGTADGAVQPTSPERSGSPESLESWDSLGREGRTFVADGPDAAQITEITGAAALEPIRVYAGRVSVDADGLDESRNVVDSLADNVVAELDRTGAFDREYLAVATTTGRGWVNQNVAASLEYLSGGDSAIAAMQYSFLPSPLAFLADRKTPKLAGRALFEAVYARWSKQPPEQRPKLLVFGESLGSYGAQDAFSGAQDIIARTDGALFVGTPNFTEQWRQITDSRDPGSREILPVIYGGENVRFASTPADLDAPGLGEWDSPRIVYWQHASDPIVWWSPSLLLNKPDWLDEPRGEDIDKGMTWVPFVSFWQVTLDMVFAAEVPYGHGHAYGPEAVYFWNQILDIDNQELSDRIFTELDN
ncbi:hypothetical protein E5720_11380 [Rhodococcus sp. PAMC28707]|uniref:alpha/beta hydrolase n=1 Tax=unclassified Rhodococcus (in: high G+C Gram-positive bacteria) TaxID=192944 RepID=UPI00109E295F|nr:MULTISPECIES: alpha/beta-hydrolase family protein [unclassified Rhodococcus (in: high G+C Gram-positive bacteria)]QCB49297.1 hypothetical protein E5769_02635 [Rhodococcus sp. PAMC28705]QCB59015.1 hypothetical protein E5720_11380 [Rhodococcus sp. PAMC28707]